jgi:hypothetical protein
MKPAMTALRSEDAIFRASKGSPESSQPSIAEKRAPNTERSASISISTSVMISLNAVVILRV